MDKLGLVGGGHDDEARQTAEIGQIERAGMGRAVGSDQTGTVDDEADGQPLNGDVVHHLIVGALQERGIDRDEGLHAFGGQSSREGDAMLLGDADVEGTLRERLAENIDAGAGRHRGGDGDDLVVLFGFLDEAVAEHLGVGGGVGLRLGLLAGSDVELDHAVILVGSGLGGDVTFALFGDNMDQGRADFRIPHVLQDRQQMVEVMTVDRADIEEAELFEQRAAGQEAAGIFLGALRALLDELRKTLGDLLADLAQRAVGVAGRQARQIGRHCADRRRDRHFVVVENHDQARIHRAGIVHGLVGHAGRHRAVTDHCDDISLLAGKIAGDGHAEAC